MRWCRVLGSRCGRRVVKPIFDLDTPLCDHVEIDNDTARRKDAIALICVAQPACGHQVVQAIDIEIFWKAKLFERFCPQTGVFSKILGNEVIDFHAPQNQRVPAVITKPIMSLPKRLALERLERIPNGHVFIFPRQHKPFRAVRLLPALERHAVASTSYLLSLGVGASPHMTCDTGTKLACLSFHSAQNWGPHPISRNMPTPRGD